MEKHPTENLSAYALGCLDAVEVEAIRAHLDGCAACRQELAACQATTELLVHAVPEVEPPASIKVQLMKSVQDDSRSYPWFERLLERWPRLVPTVSVAALLLVIVSGLLNLALLRQGDDGSKPGLAELQLARFAGTDVMPSANGVLMVTSDAKEGVLVVADMRPLDADQQYQLWLIKDGQRISGGVFSVSADGDARLVVAADIPLQRYDAFGVTIEPFGGSPGPTGPKVLGGTI